MKILFTGDAYLDDEINLSSELINLINTNDYLVVNLEGVVTDAKNTREDKATSFKIDIAHLIHLQKQVSTEIILFLVNNHIFDFGEEGFTECLKILKDNGFRCLVNSLRLKKDEQELVLCGFTSDEPSVMSVMQSNSHNFYNYYHDFIKFDDKARNIAICHWGDEYVSVPHSRILERAEKLSEVFDLTIGHHPHVIQGAMEYNNSQTYFSLGNFFLKGFTYKNGAVHIFPEECSLGLLVEYNSEINQSQAFGCSYDEKKREVQLSHKATSHFSTRSEEIDCDSKTAYIRWENSYYDYLKFRKNILVNLKSVYPKYKNLIWNFLRKIFAS